MKSPRVLVILPQQELRASVESELNKRGYDCESASDLRSAVHCSVVADHEGPIQVLIVDQATLDPWNRAFLDLMVVKHKAPYLLIVAPSVNQVITGPWDQVVFHPASTDRIVSIVERAVEIKSSHGEEATKTAA
jgi:DNA-binding NtrC family response regulator